MNKKVLILSASTGGGHNRAARAVAQELAKQPVDTVIVDALKFTNNLMDTLISKGYEASALYIPKAYGQIYRISDSHIMRKSMDINPIITYMMKKLAELVQVEKPDLIIGTHPFPVMAISNLKEEKQINVPLFSIITDFGIHHAHIASYVDKYIVGDEYVSSILETQGIPASRIHPFGIPIESSFFSPVETNTFRRNLNLKDKFTVLLMGGSFGAGNIPEVLRELIKLPEDLQIIVVSGRNFALQAKLGRLLRAENTKKNVTLLGFTDNMNYLLSLSDCIITKPGGLTTTECILKEVPMIVPFYIPGQEKDNLDFLLNSGLALKPTRNAPLKAIIKTLYNNPGKLQRIRETMGSTKKEDSASKVAQLIWDTIR